MSLLIDLYGGWQQFADALQALGYHAVCQINDEVTAWQIFSKEDGYKLQFSIFSYPEYLLFAPSSLAGGDVEDYVECETAKEARKAAYQWLLQRHCLIGIGVANA